MKNTYWADNGKHQSLYDELHKTLVPDEGEAGTTEGEFLRIMSNVYYDIYNNGGCNLNEDWAMHEDWLKLQSFLTKYKYPSEKLMHFDVYVGNFFRGGMPLPFDECDEDSLYARNTYPEVTELQKQTAFDALEDVADFTIVAVDKAQRIVNV